MGKDRRASSVVFGYDFQVNAAIVLMLENIGELQSLRLESENEDIDLELVYGKEKRKTQKPGRSNSARKDTGADGDGRCKRHGRHSATVSGNDR